MAEQLIIKTDQDVKDHFDKHDNLFGEFALEYNQIVMYWSHEGDVLTQVKFCPMCGIEFVIDRRTES